MATAHKLSKIELKSVKVGWAVFEPTLTHLKSIQVKRGGDTKYGKVYRVLGQFDVVKPTYYERNLIMITLTEKKEVYNGYGVSALNKDGKPIRHVVSETSTHFTLSVPSFGEKGDSLHGIGNVTAVKLNKAGLSALRKVLTIANVKNLNRQAFTDKRNSLATVSKAKESIANIKAGKGTPTDYGRVAKALAEGDLTEAARTEFMAALAKIG